MTCRMPADGRSARGIVSNQCADRFSTEVRMFVTLCDIVLRGMIRSEDRFCSTVICTCTT